jgi:hypothetical protein
MGELLKQFDGRGDHMKKEGMGRHRGRARIIVHGLRMGIMRRLSLALPVAPFPALALAQGIFFLNF